MKFSKLTKGFVVAVAAAGALTLQAGPASASTLDVGPVQVGTTSSDQPADLIAVSNGGTATGTGGCVESACLAGSTDYPGLVAVSTTGSATGAYLASATILSDGCASSWAVSVSLSGNACDGVVAVSVLGGATGDFLAVSGAGPAQSGGFAVTGDGAASGSSGAATVFGDASGPIVIEGSTQVQDITPDPGDFVFEATSDLVEMGVLTADEAADMAADILSDLG